MSGGSDPVAQFGSMLGVAPRHRLIGSRDRLSAVRWRNPAGQFASFDIDAHWLVHNYDSVRQTRTLGATRDASVPAGSTSVFAPGPVGEWEITQPVDLFHVYVDDRMLRYAASQLDADPRTIELRDRLDLGDPLLRSLMPALDAAVARGRSASLYASTLGLALTLRLLERHANIAVPAQPVARGGLSSRTLRQAYEFIDAHLDADVTLDGMADALGLSAKHFARAFKQSTGLPPHRYLLKRRIERAQELLAGELSLAEVALICGFADQSHFTAVFRKAVGTTPGRFREQIRPL